MSLRGLPETIGLHLRHLSDRAVRLVALKLGKVEVLGEPSDLRSGRRAGRPRARFLDHVEDLAHSGAGIDLKIGRAHV